MLTTSAYATDYKGMTFEYADGTVLSVPSDGLTIIPTADNSLLVNSAASQTEIPMTDLHRFYFAEELSSIAAPEVDTTASKVDVFTTDGIYLGSFSSIAEAESALPRGLYVLKTSGKTLKISVR